MLYRLKSIMDLRRRMRALESIMGDAEQQNRFNLLVWTYNADKFWFMPRRKYVHRFSKRG